MRERDAGQGSEGTIDRPVVVFGGGCVLHGRLCCSLARSLPSPFSAGWPDGWVGWLPGRSLARLQGFACLCACALLAGRTERWIRVMARGCQGDRLQPPADLDLQLFQGWTCAVAKPWGTARPVPVGRSGTGSRWGNPPAFYPALW